MSLVARSTTLVATVLAASLTVLIDRVAVLYISISDANGVTARSLLPQKAFPVPTESRRHNSLFTPVAKASRQS
jgi:hypothetical protein